ncbi:MAG: tRNA preQ1(34) S-adenosylmethionine ribosyltransferase-isomerase QueA [Paracoccaceae bacterium]
MSLSDFDFDLPEDLIALRPLRPRPASRMLVADSNGEHETHVSDLPNWLLPGDMLVFNDTRVIPARLFGTRYRETPDGSGVAKIELTLTRREGLGEWTALARPAKRLSPGDRVQFEGLAAEITNKDGGEVRLAFDREDADLDVAIAKAGVMPLPPYIAQRRAADTQDNADYQTVFAEKPGAVAAPTASLHFDEGLLAQLAERGILSTRLTLHVGAGTFLPVKVDDPDDHKMHAEWGEITPASAEAMNAARNAGGRLIAAGTTALRLLESAVDAKGHIKPWKGETDIFIRPGREFRAVDGLMTNFHLPKSTLFMLVSALMGTDRMQRIYAHAILNRYRFYSYGDSSLLLPG